MGLLTVGICLVVVALAACAESNSRRQATTSTGTTALSTASPDTLVYSWVGPSGACNEPACLVHYEVLLDGHWHSSGPQDQQARGRVDADEVKQLRSLATAENVERLKRDHGLAGCPETSEVPPTMVVLYGIDGKHSLNSCEVRLYSSVPLLDLIRRIDGQVHP